MNVYKGIPSKYNLFKLSNENKEKLTKDMLNNIKCCVEYQSKKYIVCMSKTELLCNNFCCFKKECKGFLSCILFDLVNRIDLNDKFPQHNYCLKEIEEYELMFSGDYNEKSI